MEKEKLETVPNKENFSEKSERFNAIPTEPGDYNKDPQENLSNFFKKEELENLKTGEFNDDPNIKNMLYELVEESYKDRKERLKNNPNFNKFLYKKRAEMEKEISKISKIQFSISSNDKNSDELYSGTLNKDQINKIMLCLNKNIQMEEEENIKLFRIIKDKLKINFQEYDKSIYRRIENKILLKEDIDKTEKEFADFIPNFKKITEEKGTVNDIKIINNLKKKEQKQSCL